MPQAQAQAAPAPAPAAQRRGRSPPSPPGTLLLGHVGAMLRDPLGALTRAQREHGDVVKFRIGAMETWLVSHPRDIERILQTDHELFHRDRTTKRLLERVAGETLVSTDGPPWLRQRRMAQPSFRPDRVRGNAPMVAREAQALCAAWRPGEERDVRLDLMRMTFRVGGQFLFGDDFARHEERTWRGVLGMRQWYGERVGRSTVLLASWLSRSYRRAVRDLEALGYAVPEERRARGAAGSDTFGLLLAARDEAGRGLSRQELRNLAVALGNASIDTTAASIGFTLSLLAQHPEAQERAAREAREALQGKPAATGDLPKLAYCEAVAKESLRLYPPTWLIGREAQQAYDIGAWRARRGTALVMSPWVVHRDARWFPEPERFRPERWLREQELPKFAYFPFGGGPHTCMGNVLAQMEVTVAVATVLQELRLAPVPGKPMEPLGSAILVPRTAWLRFAARA